MKTIALLRGINVGGKNKVPMKDLKACFLDMGFTEVETYINSGNILFKTDWENAEQSLQDYCQQRIEIAFGFPVLVSIVTADELIEAVQKAPSWWGTDPDMRHNTLFVIHPAKAEEVLSEIGEISVEFEKVAYIGNIIFWSSALEKNSRTRFSKIVGTKPYQQVTIRNANTTRKLYAMIQD
ncbi:DUF1697 domain-containing protein [Desemzia sp. RIT804]|uniref:DUF1697 domain-containing protein n=1 Tax=Desemzia sp. RIT 804 TaxID=2810209 RepID=UPI00194FB831|nr:DUF1697 domain-containing protein [Desemzia sp. RIT 804]MBM6613603.1 DUF1697 domain-containing protein [Desemzia sp. RIT 804]